MKRVFGVVLMVGLLGSSVFATTIVGVGVGVGQDLKSQLGAIQKKLQDKNRALQVSNARVSEIEDIIRDSNNQIENYHTAQNERKNVEAACRNEELEYKKQGLWNEPLAQKNNKECYKELREDLPVYSKLVTYASSLLENMKKLQTESKILGINAPVIEAKIKQLEAEMILLKGI